MEKQSRGSADLVYYFFERIFNIQREELPRVLLMFVYFMLAIGALLIGRTVRDTLFLSRYELSQLPWMYIGIAIIVSFVSVIYARIVTKFSPEKTIYLVSGFLLISLLGFRFSFSPERKWLYPAFYIWAEVLGSLVTIQFWNYANNIFNSREAKRLFGFISGGQVVGNLLVGWMVSLVVTIGSPEDLLYIGAAALGGCILIVATISRGIVKTDEEEIALRRRGASPKPKVKQQGDALEVVKTPYTMAILIMISATFIVTTFIDYQFKIQAKHTYSEDDLARFFGYFYAIVGIASFFIQFFFTGRILERFGVLISLLVMPFSFLLGSISMVIQMSLVTATATKFCENALRYTINDPTTQLLFIPLKRGFRERAQAFLYGTAKPLTIGIAGLLLLLIDKALPDIYFSYVSIFFICIWLVSIFRVKRFYITHLVQGLKDRRLNLDEDAINLGDELAVKTLLDALDSNDENQALYALEMVTRGDGTQKINEALAARLPIERLLEHSSPEIRASSLRKLPLLNRPNAVSLIIKRFSDQDISVKAEAVRSLVAVGGEKMIPEVEGFLEDLYPEIQAAAVAGLIRFGGIDGVLLSAPKLKEMLEHEDPKVRRFAANILGEIEIKHFDQPLIDLLRDEVREVRLAAIDATAKIRSSKYIPLLIEQLNDPELSSAAVMALAAHGDDVIPPLEGLLKDETAPHNTRMNAPRAIGQIDSLLASQTLVRFIDHHDYQIRHRVITNLGRVRAKLPQIDEQSQAFIKRTIIREIEIYYEMVKKITVLTSEKGPTILTEAIEHKVDQSVEHIFRLLSLLYPSKTIFTVFHNLKSEIRSERANAIEVIDNLIENELKRPLMPIVENRPQAALLKAGREFFNLSDVTADDIVWEYLATEDEWMKACVLYLIGKEKNRDFADRVEEILKSDDSEVVRETALKTMAILRGADLAPAAVEDYLKDDQPLVRNLARQIRYNESTDDIHH